MMKLKFSKGFWLIASLFALMLSSRSALAAGDSGWVTLSTIHVEAQFLTFIWTNTAVQNPDGCGNQTLVAVTDQDPLFSQKMSAILTAFAAGKSVDFWLSGCVATPWGYTAPSVYAVSIRA